MPTTDDEAPISTEVVPADPPVPALLSGVQTTFLDGKVHAGVAVEVSASGGLSTLMIPDVTGVGTGLSPVFITKPIRIEGAKLSAFLTKKGVTLPEKANALLSDTTIALEAFYFTNNKTEKVKVKKDNEPEVEEESTTKIGPLLMSFEVKFEKGIISSLTGDDSMAELFDVKKVSLRVLRCLESDLPILQNYVRELSSV